MVNKSDVDISDYRTTMGIITTILTCSTVLGNGGVILVVLFKKVLRCPTFTLILCMAFSDFLMGSLHLAFVSASWFRVRWEGPAAADEYTTTQLKAMLKSNDHSYHDISVLSENLWCDVSAYFVDIFNYLTSATTTLICVERCLALYYPLRYKVILDVPKTVKAVIITWMVAFLISLHVPIMMDKGYYVIQLAQCVPAFRNETGGFIAIRIRLSYYVITFLLTAAACGLTLRVVFKFTFAKSSVWVVRKSKLLKKTITLMLVAGLSLVTWFPQILVYLVRTCFPGALEAHSSVQQILNLRVVVWYFAYLSAALNPFVYAFRLPKFQLVVAEIRRKYATYCTENLSLEKMMLQKRPKTHCSNASARSRRAAELMCERPPPQGGPTNASYTKVTGDLSRPDSKAPSGAVIQRLDSFNI